MTERQLNESRSHQCRICLETDSIRSMTRPCICRGSIQYVHMTCLKQYLSHKFKTGSAQNRRQMRKKIKCQICKTQISSLSVKPNKRCANRDEFCNDLQGEDIFFFFLFILLYVGFHGVGILIILQDSFLSKIFGALWLILTVIFFNIGLYKIIKKICIVYEAKIDQH